MNLRYFLAAVRQTGRAETGETPHPSTSAMPVKSMDVLVYTGGCINSTNIAMTNEALIKQTRKTHTQITLLT